MSSQNDNLDIDSTDVGEDEEKKHTDADLRKSFLSGAYTQIVILAENGYFAFDHFEALTDHVARLRASLAELGGEFETDEQLVARAQKKMKESDPIEIPIDFNPFGPGIDA